MDDYVSTHSRPKAAGRMYSAFSAASSFQHTAARRRLVVPFKGQSHTKKSFNTQPPEGGWKQVRIGISVQSGFNTQPPEGGWLHFR